MHFKKWFSVMTLPLLLTLTSCNLFNQTIKTDHFTYEVNLFRKEATLIRLTELGKSASIWVIPPLINKYPVKYIGSTPLLGDLLGALIVSDVQKKVYLPSSLADRVGLAAQRIQDVVTILNMTNPTPTLINSIKRFYDATLHYISDDTALNVFFMANYDDAANEGYYWVDFVDETSSYVMPVDPIRKNHAFAGWYNEVECLTPWDEVMPSSSEASVTVYARWDKN